MPDRDWAVPNQPLPLRQYLSLGGISANALGTMAGRSLQSRPPLKRMMRIVQRLQAGGYPNCTQLAEALEVSTKTVQRDIAYLRDQMGYPIEYAESCHGYCLTGEITGMPAMSVSEGEVLSLLVAQQALAQYAGTPFERPLRTALGKLAGAMQDAVTVEPAALAAALSFRPAGATGAAQPVKPEIFAQVTRALLDQKRLTFTYRKLQAPRPEKRTVRPYHLACIDHQWYLFAHDEKRRQMRTFVLGRIQKVEALGEPFERPKDFSLADQLLGSFGVFKGEGDFRVRIAFDSFASRLVAERTWHPTQEITERPDGTCELALRLASLEEIERWVLSWGRHAEVLAPAQLKSRVKNALREMSGKYAPPAAHFMPELHALVQEHQADRLLEFAFAADRACEDPNQLTFRLDGQRESGRM